MARQSTPVLVTRPQAEAEAFAATLSERFGAQVRPVVTPLLAPTYLRPELPSADYGAVIFTSAHAVEGARRLGGPLPRTAWCVGRKTAAVAAAAGFHPISADGDVDALATLLLADPPNGRILYSRGVDTTGNLLEILNNNGVTTDVAIVYRQDPLPLSDEAMTHLQTPGAVIVPLFSARTAQIFLSALPEPLRARLHVAAMSSAVARVVERVPLSALSVARTPDAPGMLGAVESLLVRLPAP